MDLGRLIQQTVAIQAIPAPTFDETARAHYMRDLFTLTPLQDIHLDKVGNLLGKIPGGSRPPIVVSAHLDTVFPRETDLSSEQVDDQLRGPGVGDNAVSLAVLLELAHDLSDRDLPGDVWLVATVCEEGLGNLRGMRSVVERFGRESSAYVVLEGTMLGHIYHQALPIRRFQISFRSAGGHSWLHADRPSALHVLMSMGNTLLQIKLPSEPRTTLNIGRAEGGTAINAVASEASLQLDLRSESESVLNELVHEVHQVVSQHRSHDMSVDIEGIGDRPGGGIPANHPLVSSAKEALRSVGLAEVRLETASTDASVPLSMGIPSVCMGLTRGGGAHSLREYIEIPPLEEGYRALVAFIQTIFQLDV